MELEAETDAPCLVCHKAPAAQIAELPYEAPIYQDGRRFMARGVMACRSCAAIGGRTLFQRLMTDDAYELMVYDIEQTEGRPVTPDERAWCTEESNLHMQGIMNALNQCTGPGRMPMWAHALACHVCGC